MRRGPLLALAVAIVVAVGAIAALVLLFRLGARHPAEPELPDTWRPYG